MRIPIIYQDENIVVVNKPIGLSTHAADEHDPGALDLIAIIKTQLGVDYLGTHQRLDKDTSGVLLFSLRREVNPALAHIFEGREAGKTYLAIVHGALDFGEVVRRFAPRPAPRPLPMPAPRGGRPAPYVSRNAPPARGQFDRRPPAGRPLPPPPRPQPSARVTVKDGVLTISAPIAPARESGRWLVPAGPDKLAQEATTQVRIVATSPDSHYTLLEVTPLTGRSHQIRIHLAHIGHSVVGDPLYGPQNKPAPRVMLHALELDIPALTVTSSIPQEVARNEQVPFAPAADITSPVAAQSAPLAAVQTPARNSGWVVDKDGMISSLPPTPTLTHDEADSEARPPSKENDEAALESKINPAFIESAESEPHAEINPPVTEDETQPSTQHIAPSSASPQSFRAEPPPIFERVSTGLPELDLAQRLAIPVAPAPYRPGRFAMPVQVESDRLTIADRPAIATLFAIASERRALIADDATTDIYRLVNAAADGLPGITVDRYANVLILSLYQDTAPDIERMLVETLVQTVGEGYSVYLKRRPRTAATISDSTAALVAPSTPAYGPKVPQLTARESGLSYIIRPADGLSVGLFADMRETRLRVRRWASGRSVLNCFAYTCGFGVAASLGGASRVVNLDLSRHYLEWGMENYAANGLTASERDFIFGDVSDWFFRFHKREEKFDLVILDPPSFSTAKQSGDKGSFSAANDYGKLAELAARIVNPGGMLIACTNHSGLNRRTFREMTLGGVQRAGRFANVAGYYREPALDFPAPGNEEGYLKILALELK